MSHSHGRPTLIYSLEIPIYFMCFVESLFMVKQLFYSTYFILVGPHPRSR